MLRNSVFMAAALLSVGIANAETAPIKDVSVETDITAIDNAKAASYWANVSADIENAIAARLVDRTAEEGSEIKIDINELSLANSFQSALGLEDAVLVGQVNVINEMDNAKYDAYELTISAKAAQAYGPEGLVLEGAFTDTPEYYAALVNAFADGVVTRLK